MKTPKNHIAPPRVAKKLLLWFLKDELAEEVLGDLDEKFHYTLNKHSRTKARRNYWCQVFNYLRPFAFKKNRSFHSNSTAMFKHNILITLRSFRRYKSTFLINLFGLAVGLASTLLIYLWVNDELNMGRFHQKDSKRHFQVMRNIPLSTGIQTKETSPGPLAEALRHEFPEVEYAFSLVDGSERIVSFNDKHLRATPRFVGKGYLNVFRCDFVAGDKDASFSEVNNIVISEKIAVNLFRSANQAIGETILFKDSNLDEPFVVSGVFKSDHTLSPQFDFLISYDYYLAKFPFMKEWHNGGIQSHVVLKPEIDSDRFNRKIRDFLKTKQKGIEETLFVQKYSDRYLYGKYENGFPAAGRMVNVRIFSLIALFVLIIACINYMNLSTAQASRRIKEIGVKKAIGVQRKALIYQYFSESIFMAFLSLILATCVTVLLLPQFNQITSKQLSIQQASDIALPIFIITLLTGIISGIYPGVYLSRFRPTLALKGRISTGSGSLWLRKGLVIFQFATSVTLIIAVIVVYRQMNFIQESNLGYDNENIISFRKEGKSAENASAFISEIQKIPGVVKLSTMAGTLPGDVGGRSNLKWEGQKPEEIATRFVLLRGDYGLAELLNVELKEGRFFSREFPTDSRAIILNEAAAELVGFKNPIGKQVWMGKDHVIIGIVKNFHFEGMQERIKPLFFQLWPTGNNFMVKIQAKNQIETIDRIKDLHNSFNPGYPFEFRFLDQGYQKLYDEEKRTATLSKYFAGIAIAISCLGLLALTSFSTQQRFKEIAIRKVLGASSAGIVRLISREFIVLVLIAIIIALPVGYYLMKNWLDGFAYRIDLEPIYFIVPGSLMLVVAWLTIFGQTAKSANVNVTESLRGE